MDDLHCQRHSHSPPRTLPAGCPRARLLRRRVDTCFVDTGHACWYLHLKLHPTRLIACIAMPQRPPVGSAVSDSATRRHYVSEDRKRGPHKKTVAAALPKTTKELLAVNSCVQYLLNATENYRQLCRHCVIRLKWQRTSSHAGVWIARSRGPAHHKNTGCSRLSGWHLIAALFLLIPASERVRDQALLGSRVAHRWLQPQLPQRHVGRAT